MSNNSFRTVANARANPGPGPQQTTVKDDLSELNISRGERIRVLKDNGRRGLVGLEGTVVQSFPGAVVVELENDPLTRFRSTNAYGMGGFEKPMRQPRRHFRVTEVERA